MGVHLLVVEVWFLMSTLNVITGRALDLQKKLPNPPPPEVPVLTLLEMPRPKPMTFVETDPRQESKEPPKDSSLYSDRSTRAAQPKPSEKDEGDKPRLEGEQEKVLSTANVPLPKPLPAPPLPSESVPPKPETPAPEAADPKPKGRQETQGGARTDLALLSREPGRPATEKPPPAPAAEPKQARLTTPPSERIIPEAEMKTRTSSSKEGIKAFDVTGTKFGEYDRRLIAAVKSRWLALLEQYTIPGERAGQVALRFHLNSNGTVTELAIAENTAGDILALYCQKAVTDSAPFGEWPEELKNAVKRNYREFNFIFYY